MVMSPALPTARARCGKMGTLEKDGSSKPLSFDGNPLLHRKYRSIVGCLSYLVNMTRPDLAFSFSQLSKFLQYPGEAHLAAAYRVLAYVKGTLHQGLEGKPKQVVRLGGQRFRL